MICLKGKFAKINRSYLMPTKSPCELISVDVVAQALGDALIKPPQPFQDDYLGDGCQYDAGKDRSGHARFAYAAIAPAASFDATKTMGSVTPIGDLGDAAFTIDGEDAQQLWVLVKGRGAIVVALGDAPNPSGARQIAGYLIAALSK
jgi:hypothetical protein